MSGMDSAVMMLGTKEEAEKLTSFLKVNNIESKLESTVSDIYAVGSKRFSYIIYVAEKDAELASEIVKRFAESSTK